MLTSSSPAVASRSDRPADVRSDQRIASLVDKALAQFGLSESSSSDDESEFGEGKKKRRSRQIAKIFRVSDLSDSGDLVYITAFLFAFFLFARICNIVPYSVNSFHPSRNLCRGDISGTEEGLLVTFRRTKTIQFGHRRLHIPLPPFLLKTKSSAQVPVTKSQFVAVFRHKLQLAGIDNPEEFSGHSFRRGGATWAFQAGMPGELIQSFGDWSSDAYK
ncbi:hypothetical protein QZH41_017314, partial [Actinostola sp. cb2023]